MRLHRVGAVESAAQDDVDCCLVLRILGIAQLAGEAVGFQLKQLILQGLQQGRGSRRRYPRQSPRGRSSEMDR